MRNRKGDNLSAMRVAIQGEAGSFSHQAAKRMVPGGSMVPCVRSAEVFDRLERGSVAAAVIPIENSLAGSVAEHFDLLLARKVFIQREFRLRIVHNLIAAPGVRKSDVRRVLSHPVSPVSVGGTVSQTLYNGFQTANRTRQAESAVLAARATLRTGEQTVLLSAVTAYMNLLRDSAILDLQRRNVEVLQEQLRQTRDRFNVGEVTRTDVAQSESRLAAGRSQVLTAEANYKASAATYRQVIGSNPGKLSPGSPVDRFSPASLPGAIGSATASHPAVTTAQYNVDVAQLAVKVAEGALYPTVSVQGNFQKNYATVGNLNTIESYNASVLGSLSVPIYQGGAL